MRFLDFGFFFGSYCGEGGGGGGGWCCLCKWGGGDVVVWGGGLFCGGGGGGGGGGGFFLFLLYVCMYVYMYWFRSSERGLIDCWVGIHARPAEIDTLSLKTCRSVIYFFVSFCSTVDEIFNRKAASPIPYQNHPPPPIALPHSPLPHFSSHLISSHLL